MLRTTTIPSRRLLARSLALSAVLLTALALGAGSARAASPSWGISMSHQNAWGAAGEVDPNTNSTTTLARGSGANVYTVTVTNAGDAPAGGVIVRPGQTLSCQAGPDSATSFTYQWIRNGVTVLGATRPNYTLSSIDAGTMVQCRVTAGNNDGATAATSTAIGIMPISAIVPPPTSGRVAISGTPNIGGAGVTCGTGTWTGAPTYAFRWLRDGVPIPGATSSTYTPTVDDANRALQCEVTGANVGGTVVAASTSVIVLAPPTTASNVRPVITGTVPNLTCSPGVWTPAVPTPTFSYQWLRNGQPITGATGTGPTATYTTTPADDGSSIQCQVTAANLDGSAVNISQPQAVGAIPTPAPPTPPAVLRNVSGPKTVGATVTCAAGSWSTGASAPTAYVYQWLRNGVAIPDARSGPSVETQAQYTVSAADRGTYLQCQVTGQNAGGATTIATRGDSAPIVPVPPRAASTVPVPGSVSLAVRMPDGVRLRGSATSTSPVSGGGWDCNVPTSSSVTCTRSDTLAPGASFPPLKLAAHVNRSAADSVAPVATVAGGGAAPNAVTTTDPTSVTTVPFGIRSFVTNVVDANGAPYTQAGGHPFAASTRFVMNSTSSDIGRAVTASGDAKRIQVDLPAGFMGNPQGTPTCPLALLPFPEQRPGSLCPDNTAVGFVSAAPGGTSIPASPWDFQRAYVHLVEATPGHPAMFGFNLLKEPVVLKARLRSNGDYGLTVGTEFGPEFSASDVEFTFCKYGVSHSGSYPFDAFSCAPSPVSGHEVPFLTLPTACSSAAPLTGLRLTNWQDPGHGEVSQSAFAGAASGAVPDPAASFVTGCDQLPFDPSVSIEPTVKSPDKPTGLDVGMHFPQDGLTKPDGVATAHLKKATVSLPAGLTINPAAAGGLTACTDEQLQLHSLDPMICPNAAKIGTATATTPVLAETLTGSVYMRTQNSTDPESGQMFRIALVLESKVRGISVRLPGEIRADATTGRLTATFDNNPRLPVGDIKLAFKSGSRAPLATPKTCEPHTIDAALTSWGGQSADRRSTFTVGCTPGLGWFGPLFSAGTTSPVAGANTSFVLRINKPDGQSDMNGIALSLPEGLLASLKGNIGRQIGTASVGAGPGPSPFWLSGPVVLEGPYGDAPFSLRVTVPVIAGPFNLGDVVVRQKIYVDPHDAHVTVVSDPLPTIVKGVPVRLQDLRVNIDKAVFMRNPTSCAPKAIGGTLGADTGQTAAVASRFQVGACANLPLRPKMAMELKGSKQIKRGKHPMLSTTLTQQPGESNLKSVKVRLPLSLALDPDNAEALCKPEQAAAKACPAASIVGHATAISPVLNQPLTGDVFFVEGTRQSKQGRTVKTLPKLWVALRGEVAIDVWADSSISQGKYLVTTFGFIPDAPISSFKLDINGGQHGILAVTGDSGANLCQRRLITDASYVGQNGKRVQSKVHMDSPCGFKVRQKSVSISHAKVTVSGISAGKLTISGKGIHKTSRTIKHSKVATLKPRLTATGKRLYKGRKAIRLRVSFNPKAKGQKIKHTTTVVKRAKKSSTRAHRTR